MAHKTKTVSKVIYGASSTGILRFAMVTAIPIHFAHETWMCITISMFPILFQKYILAICAYTVKIFGLL